MAESRDRWLLGAFVLSGAAGLGYEILWTRLLGLALGSETLGVLGVLAGFFAESPLDVYQGYFNVHRVDVLSNESGVDNDPTQGIQRDTAMGV